MSKPGKTILWTLAAVAAGALIGWSYASLITRNLPFIYSAKAVVASTLSSPKTPVAGSSVADAASRFQKTVNSKEFQARLILHIGEGVSLRAEPPDRQGRVEVVARSNRRKGAVAAANAIAELYNREENRVRETALNGRLKAIDRQIRELQGERPEDRPGEAAGDSRPREAPAETSGDPRVAELAGKRDLLFEKMNEVYSRKRSIEEAIEIDLLQEPREGLDGGPSERVRRLTAKRADLESERERILGRRTEKSPDLIRLQEAIDEIDLAINKGRRNVAADQKNAERRRMELDSVEKELERLGDDLDATSGKMAEFLLSPGPFASQSQDVALIGKEEAAESRSEWSASVEKILKAEKVKLREERVQVQAGVKTIQNAANARDVKRQTANLIAAASAIGGGVFSLCVVLAMRKAGGARNGARVEMKALDLSRNRRRLEDPAFWLSIVSGQIDGRIGVKSQDEKAVMLLAFDSESASHAATGVNALTDCIGRKTGKVVLVNEAGLSELELRSTVSEFHGNGDRNSGGVGQEQPGFSDYLNGKAGFESIFQEHKQDSYTKLYVSRGFATGIDDNGNKSMNYLYNLFIESLPDIGYSVVAIHLDHLLKNKILVEYCIKFNHICLIIIKNKKNTKGNDLLNKKLQAHGEGAFLFV